MEDAVISAGGLHEVPLKLIGDHYYLMFKDIQGLSLYASPSELRAIADEMESLDREYNESV